jgi:hypothetical protein
VSVSRPRRTRLTPTKETQVGFPGQLRRGASRRPRAETTLTNSCLETFSRCFEVLRQSPVQAIDRETDEAHRSQYDFIDQDDNGGILRVLETLWFESESQLVS